MTEVQTEMNENVNDVQNEENAEMTETVDTENTEATENAYVMPDKDSIDFGVPVINEVAKQILVEIETIRDIDAILEQQKTNFSETKLIDYAGESDDPELKRAFEQYQKQVERLKQLTVNLTEKVAEKIGGEKLSDEEIAAKKETRKTNKDTVDNAKKILENLAAMAGDRQSEVIAFLENVNVPGARGSSGTRSSDSGTAAPKPRLNGGTVQIGNQNHKNFPQAANHMSTLLGRDVPNVELINAWVDAANVGNWKDAPEIVEFTFEGHDVKVVKLPKGSK